MARLGRGEQDDSVPAKLWIVFRPSVQGYLISWMRHDPAHDIAALTVPVLIAQGTTDIQVDTTDARRLAAGDPSARLLLVPGMNHVLKMVPADPAKQAASYSDPSLPDSPALVEASRTWCGALGGPRECGAPGPRPVRRWWRSPRWRWRAGPLRKRRPLSFLVRALTAALFVALAALAVLIAVGIRGLPCAHRRAAGGDGAGHPDRHPSLLRDVHLP